ncbi:MAG: hypothetical protein M3R69_16700 [Acidobacteriota bacterium]|nr:hypothetical protein [Acidobacteriota bacterium]
MFLRQYTYLRAALVVALTLTSTTLVPAQTHAQRKEDIYSREYNSAIMNRVYDWQLAKPVEINQKNSNLDTMLDDPQPGREDWWWCDALFMAPVMANRFRVQLKSVEYAITPGQKSPTWPQSDRPESGGSKYWRKPSAA